MEMVIKTETFEEHLTLHVSTTFGGGGGSSVEWWNKNWSGRKVDVDFDVYKMDLQRIWACRRPMDEFVLELMHQARAGVISGAEYHMMRGQYHGYKVCCIKNYINLLSLGYSPALFMSVVNGSTAQTDHVLCPQCEAAWEGERRVSSYHDADEERAQYQQLLNQLK
jgi:hypothetical protein